MALKASAPALLGCARLLLLFACLLAPPPLSQAARVDGGPKAGKDTGPKHMLTQRRARPVPLPVVVASLHHRCCRCRSSGSNRVACRSRTRTTSLLHRLGTELPMFKAYHNALPKELLAALRCAPLAYPVADTSTPGSPPASPCRTAAPPPRHIFSHREDALLQHKASKNGGNLKFGKVSCTQAPSCACASAGPAHRNRRVATGPASLPGVPARRPCPASSSRHPLPPAPSPAARS